MRGQAVVFQDKGIVRFSDVEIPEPGEEDVVVQVDYSWISTGTEASFLRGERVAGEDVYKAGMEWPFPIVSGYQKTGTVLQVGNKVNGIKAGDKVFAALSRISGMFKPVGGHINPAVCAQKQVWKLPEGADPLDYCGLVLTQVGVNCGMKPTI